MNITYQLIGLIVLEYIFLIHGFYPNSLRSSHWFVRQRTSFYSYNPSNSLQNEINPLTSITNQFKILGKQENEQQLSLILNVLQSATPDTNKFINIAIAKALNMLSPQVIQSLTQHIFNQQPFQQNYSPTTDNNMTKSPVNYFSPDITCLTALISTCNRYNMFQEAMQIYSYIQHHQLPKDSRLYQTIVITMINLQLTTQLQDTLLEIKTKITHRKHLISILVSLITSLKYTTMLSPSQCLIQLTHIVDWIYHNQIPVICDASIANAYLSVIIKLQKQLLSQESLSVNTPLHHNNISLEPSIVAEYYPSFYQLLEYSHVSSDYITYGILLDLFSSLYDETKAWNMMNYLLDKKIPTLQDLLSTSSSISSSASDVTDIQTIAKQMCLSIPSKHSLVYFGCLLNMYLKICQYEKIQMLVEIMKENQIPYQHDSYIQHILKRVSSTVSSVSSSVSSSVTPSNSSNLLVNNNNQTLSHSIQHSKTIHSTSHNNNNTRNIHITHNTQNNISRIDKTLTKHSNSLPNTHPNKHNPSKTTSNTRFTNSTTSQTTPIYSKYYFVQSIQQCSTLSEGLQYLSQATSSHMADDVVYLTTAQLAGKNKQYFQAFLLIDHMFTKGIPIKPKSISVIYQICFDYLQYCYQQQPKPSKQPFKPQVKGQTKVASSVSTSTFENHMNPMNTIQLPLLTSVDELLLSTSTSTSTPVITSNVSSTSPNISSNTSASSPILTFNTTSLITNHLFGLQKLIEYIDLLSQRQLLPHHINSGQKIIKEFLHIIEIPLALQLYNHYFYHHYLSMNLFQQLIHSLELYVHMYEKDKLKPKQTTCFYLESSYWLNKHQLTHPLHPSLHPLNPLNPSNNSLNLSNNSHISLNDSTTSLHIPLTMKSISSYSFRYQFAKELMKFICIYVYQPVFTNQQSQSSSQTINFPRITIQDINTILRFASKFSQPWIAKELFLWIRHGKPSQQIISLFDPSSSFFQQISSLTSNSTSNLTSSNSFSSLVSLQELQPTIFTISEMISLCRKEEDVDLVSDVIAWGIQHHITLPYYVVSDALSFLYSMGRKDKVLQIFEMIYPCHQLDSWSSSYYTTNETTPSQFLNKPPTNSLLPPQIESVNHWYEIDMHGYSSAISYAIIKTIINKIGQDLLQFTPNTTTETNNNTSLTLKPHQILIFITGKNEQERNSQSYHLTNTIQDMLIEDFYPPISSSTLPGNSGRLVVDLRPYFHKLHTLSFSSK